MAEFVAILTPESCTYHTRDLTSPTHGTSHHPHTGPHINPLVPHTGPHIRKKVPHTGPHIEFCSGTKSHTGPHIVFRSGTKSHTRYQITSPVPHTRYQIAAAWLTVSTSPHDLLSERHPAGPPTRPHLPGSQGKPITPGTTNRRCFTMRGAPPRASPCRTTKEGQRRLPSAAPLPDPGASRARTLV